MSEYIFKRIEKNVYHDIRTLYTRSFYSKRSMEYMYKKYNTSFFGLSDIGYIAYDKNDSPAAYYGVFPIIISINSKDVLVAQSGDTMTDPEHRKKGLFTKLALMTYELAKNEGVKFVFGFPNKNSLPGFERKLNWEFYGNMKEFKIKTNAFPLAEISSKSLFLRRIHKKYCKVILDSKIINRSDSEISNINFENPDSFIKKDTNFFNYKQFSSTFLIRYNDFTIFIKPEVHLNIGAVEKFDKKRINDFIKTIKKLAFKLGCRKIVIPISKNHWLYSIISKNSNSKECIPIGFLRFSDEYRFENISFIGSDYDTF